MVMVVGRVDPMRFLLYGLPENAMETFDDFLKKKADYPGQRKAPLDCRCPRWAFEIFRYSCWANNVSHEIGLLCATENFRKGRPLRITHKFWSTPIVTRIYVSRATYIRLGVLGLIFDGKRFLSKNPKHHITGADVGYVITKAAFKLPELLRRDGYTVRQGIVPSPRSTRIEVNLPNGIFLELMRDSEEREVGFNYLLREALVHTRKIQSLKFGKGSRKVTFLVSEQDQEKLYSFSTIYQIDVKHVIILVLGSYYFVGEATSEFLKNEEGLPIELWD